MQSIKVFGMAYCIKNLMIVDKEDVWNVFYSVVKW